LFENHNPTMHITYLQETLIFLSRLFESYNLAIHITYFQETLIFYHYLCRSHDLAIHIAYLQETLIFFGCVSCLVSIEGYQRFVLLCFILSSFLKLVFCLVTTLWAYVLSHCHLVNLCFITSSLHDFVFLPLVRIIASMFVVVDGF